MMHVTETMGPYMERMKHWWVPRNYSGVPPMEPRWVHETRFKCRVCGHETPKRSNLKYAMGDAFEHVLWHQERPSDAKEPTLPSRAGGNHE